VGLPAEIGCYFPTRVFVTRTDFLSHRIFLAVKGAALFADRQYASITTGKDGAIGSRGTP
jgi:hypothetical protein